MSWLIFGGHLLAAFARSRTTLDQVLDRRVWKAKEVRSWWYNGCSRLGAKAWRLRWMNFLLNAFKAEKRWWFGTWRKQWPSGGWRSTIEQRRPRGHSEDHLQEQSQTGHGSQGLSPPKSKYCVIVQQSVWLRVYLRTCSTILDLAGVETLLIRVLHAGKDPCGTEAHWIDGALIMERHSIRDDLKKVHNLKHVALFWTH